MQHVQGVTTLNVKLLYYDGHFSLVVEDGGTLDPTITNFIAMLASKAGGSSAERDAYTIFVTQRIRAACMKGVSDILVSRFPAGAIPRAPRRSLLPLAQPKPRPAASRQLHALRSQSVVAPWQLAALPIPPGPFTSPPPIWSPVRRPFLSGRPSLVPPQPLFPATAPLVRAVTSPTALHP